MEFTAALAAANELCAAQDIEAWIVGGWLRDRLLARPTSDLDLVVSADGFAVAQALAEALGATFVPLDRARGTGRLVFFSNGERLQLDVSSLHGATIDADLRARDLTINALALPLSAYPAFIAGQRTALRDPCGGQADLAAGRLVLCSPTSLQADPLRILRIFRFASSLGFTPSADARAAIPAARAGLASVAGERIRDELLRILDRPGAAEWLRQLDQAGALTVIFPELEPARTCTQPRVHRLPVLAHSLETVAAVGWLIDQLLGEATPPTSLPLALQRWPALQRGLPFADRLAPLMGEGRGAGYRRAALLRLAALLHDNAKPQTKQVEPSGKVTFYGHQTLGAEVVGQIGRRLRLSNDETAYIVRIVAEHMRPGQMRGSNEPPSRRAIVRFFRECAGAGPDVLLHELADHLATRADQTDPQGWQAHLAWVAALLEVEFTAAPSPLPPLVRGDELIAAFDLRPGPLIGELLRQIDEARAAGEISTPREAMALAQAWLADAAPLP